jgi:hypothetical protein
MKPVFIIIFALALACFWGSPVQAATYYVHKDHPSASDANAGTSQALPWSTITKANTTLVAGDTVYIKAGTYTAGTTNYIAPVNSGTSSTRITYRNFGSDVVTIQQGAYAIDLNGNDYITVQGLRFTNLDRFMYLRNSADFNIIDGNTFATMRNLSAWEGSRIYQSSDHNILRNNIFKEYGVCAGANDQGAVIDIGLEDGTGDTSDFNLFENNVFARGGHHVMGMFSRFNVIRNNYFYNDPWTAGKGNRTLYMEGDPGFSGFNLVENNRFGYSSIPCDQGGAHGMMMADSNNIFRYNALYHNNLNGLGLQVYNTNASSNLIYNNTFFNNAAVPNASVGASEKGAITLGKWNPPLVQFNKIINNLFYSHPFDGGQPIGQNGALRSDQIISNNFDGDVSGNPLFLNASTTPPSDITDRTLPNLSLQSGSPAINAGGHLTTVSSGCGGSSTNLVLTDATFFQDGRWGVTGEIQADWIAVGTVTNVKQIALISGNTVTLVSPISCINGNAVWLYKDSSGRQVLQGSAPDIGAYENFGGDATPPAAPTGLRVVS